MRISFHGGKCCAIKHIHGLKADPNAICWEKEETSFDSVPNWTLDKKKNPDQWGQDVSSETNFFYPAAPRETYIKRFDRMLAYLDEVRPHGITEVVLCNYEKYDDEDRALNDQLPGWEPLLFERAFVLVTSCYNSNSSNRVFIYHRKTDKE